MKYTLTLIVSAFLTGALFYGIVLNLAPAPILAEYWVKEMITIKLGIAKKHFGRKIVIASGSSTLFNLDTKTLSSDLNIPVINLGLHAGLSLEKVLKVADLATDSKDILILPLEESYYVSSNIITSWQAINTIAWEPELWDELSLLDKLRSINAIGPELIYMLIKTAIQLHYAPDALETRLSTLNQNNTLQTFNPLFEPESFAYSAYNLDALGNMKMTDGSNYLGPAYYSPEDEIIISSSSRKLLTSFVVRMRSKGVAVYFANQPYLKYKEFNMRLVEKTSEEFKSNLSSIAPIIDDKQDLIFERKLFFNTGLHLNSDGRRINTERFKNAIKSKVPL